MDDGYDNDSSASNKPIQFFIQFLTPPRLHTVEFPATMTCAELKDYCSRISGVPPSRQWFNLCGRIVLEKDTRRLFEDGIYEHCTLRFCVSFNG